MPLHPMFVHFPIVLFFVSLALDGFARYRNHLISYRYGVAVLAGALTSSILAVITGSASEEAAERVVSESLIEQHEMFATAFLLLTATLTVWRAVGRLVARRRGDQSFVPLVAPVYFGAAVLAAVVLIAAGHTGASLVYEHGAGIPVVVFQ
jgi:uncharacterized membrane protein